MNTAQVNCRIQEFLRDLADEGTFRMRKKTGGHPVCVASYGGVERAFGLSSSPGGNYQKNIRASLNRFVRSLNIENKPTFNF